MNADPVWHVTPRPACLGKVQGTLHADIAIVGGGLTGLSTAYHLLVREPTLHVVIMDAGHVGSGASTRNTGMLGPGVGQNLLGLIDRVGDDAAESLYRRTLSAVTLVRDLVAKENLACDLTMGGQIHWARSIAGRRRLAAQAHWLNERGLPAEMLDDESLRDCVCLPETAGRGRGLPAALRLPDAGILDPGKLVARLAIAAQLRGAQIFEGSMVSALAGGGPGGKVSLSLVGGGKVLADQTVIATAGYTGTLGRLIGRVIPMQIQAVASEPIPTSLLEQIGWHRREGIIETQRVFNYFRLSAENRLIFGGGAPRPYQPRDRQIQALPQSTQQTLANAFFTTFPDLATEGIRITHGWSGTIGYVINGIPIIGRSHDNPNILHAVGWSGHGIAMGVAAGSWIADLIDRAEDGGGAVGALDLFGRYPTRVPFTRLHGLAIRAGGAAMRMMDRFE